uniref:Uncharacterized protein n=1 Tax=Oryza brachyantha TaxID=4533 RepID=J3MFC7_ORYBR
MHSLRLPGISPWMALFHKPRISSLEHEESSAGMLPSKEFMLRLRFLSSLRKPSLDGMLPWKLLSDSCSVVREVRLAMQGDMVPVMPSDARSIATTRCGRRALQVTPSQLQRFKDVLLHDHEDRALDGPES